VKNALKKMLRATMVRTESNTIVVFVGEELKWTMVTIMGLVFALFILAIENQTPKTK
jgi:hypothetical protein